MKKFSALILVAGFLMSCSSQQERQTQQTGQTAASTDSSFSRDYQIGSFLWFQTSGEFRALCYQAYHLARLKLDRDLENKHNKKRALIFDIDETVFDNSLGGSDDIVKRKNWSPQNFADWTKLKRAVALPGAVDFIKYAVSQRVEVFFISNRTTEMFEDTLENLRAQGFPAKKENLLLAAGDNSKETRRELVRKNYEVVLYVGDNLIDFDKDWDKKSWDERRALVDQRRNEFGDKFIVLPNPLYGDWENSLPKNVDRRQLLKSIQ